MCLSFNEIHLPILSVLLHPDLAQIAPRHARRPGSRFPGLIRVLGGGGEDRFEKAIEAARALGR